MSIDEEVLALRAFAQSVLQGWPQDDGIGAIELQDIATEHGLLQPHEMSAPCEGRCLCAECDCEFPLTCYRKTPLLKGRA